MVAKALSTFLKTKYKPMIQQRDGMNCFYCDKPFQSKLMSMITLSVNADTEVFDHLNNDATDNRPENLVLAHSVCNEHKKNNNEWIVKAKQKLRDNERSANIPIAHAGTDKETATETDTNAIFAEIVLKELADKLLPKNNGVSLKEELPLKEFLDLVSAKGYKICGHASQNTMRRIVDMFCTTEFPYIKEKNESKRSVIRLRSEKEYDQS